MKILKEKNIPTAFAKNEKAGVDQHIIGVVSDIQENNQKSDFTSYSIDCNKYNGSEYGLQYKVAKNNGQYKIKCTGENPKGNKTLYKHNEPLTYTMGNDGILENTAKTPLVIEGKKEGYVKI